MSDKKHSGEVAFITGGGRGLGLAIGKLLGKEGATVVLLDVSNDDLLNAANELKEDNINVHTHVLDVTNSVQVNEVFDKLVKELGQVDILVQSAGITGRTNIKTHEVDINDFQRVMNVNLNGIFYCCQAVIKYMLKNNYGRIVNIASISGKEGNAGMLAYSTSKAAVIGLTKVIGKEYADTGITCNALAPAVVRTKMVAALPEEQVKYMTDKIPMKRCGREEEIASMVSFIASKSTSFTTGFTFDATGGRATY